MVLFEVKNVLCHIEEIAEGFPGVVFGCVILPFDEIVPLPLDNSDIHNVLAFVVMPGPNLLARVGFVRLFGHVM